MNVEHKHSDVTGSLPTKEIRAGAEAALDNNDKLWSKINFRRKDTWRVAFASTINNLYPPAE